MKQHLKQILLVQGIVFTALGGFANTAHKTEAGSETASTRSKNFTQNNCFFFNGVVNKEENGTGNMNYSFIIPAMSVGDTGSAVGNYNAKMIPAKALVNFVAAATENFFDLSWNTLSENTSDHFEVERSLDGEHFLKVGEVKGKDVPSGKIYSFKDKVRPVVVRNNDFYYRLKQIDPNGSAFYSKVLVARMYNSKKVYAISVTPDASINDILVNVQLKDNSFVVMKLKDKKGNEILKRTENGDFGSNTYLLNNTRKLQPGVYSLEVIINSNERLTMQLVKS